MGVLPCVRYDCDNIMCDFLIDSIGYVCDSCIEEFRSYIGLEELNDTNMKIQLGKFLDTDVNIGSGQKIYVDEFINKHRR